MKEKLFSRRKKGSEVNRNRNRIKPKGCDLPSLG
jgi:hypothetical protein